MTQLRVIRGGRAPRSTTSVLVSDLEGLHLELVIARAERITYAAKVRDLVRRVERQIATGHEASAGMYLEMLARLNSQEEQRALAMDTSSCPCGLSGSGHGDADEDALAVPAERAA